MTDHAREGRRMTGQWTDVDDLYVHANAVVESNPEYLEDSIRTCHRVYDAGYTQGLCDAIHYLGGISTIGVPPATVRIALVKLLAAIRCGYGSVDRADNQIFEAINDKDIQYKFGKP